jgi:hypothetical protein
VVNAGSDDEVVLELELELEEKDRMPDEHWGTIRRPARMCDWAA